MEKSNYFFYPSIKMEIKIDDIPDFLKNSEFISSLDINEQSFITIPKLKLSESVLDLDDFLELFKTINFFGVKKYPRAFTRFYQENSIDVFNSLNNENEEEEFLLKDLAKLKIKNPYQFFITYKIINRYSLNPEKYNNYLYYANNNCKDIIGSGEYYIINDKEFENLADKVSGTVFIEFISIRNLDREYIVNLKINKCGFLTEKDDKNGNCFLEKGFNYSKNMEISIFSLNKEEFLENIINLMLSIKNNKYFLNKHTKKTILDIISYPHQLPKYYDKKLSLLNRKNYDNYITISFKINEFNKNNVIEELQKILDY